MEPQRSPFWSLPAAQVLGRLADSAPGSVGGRGRVPAEALRRPPPGAQEAHRRLDPSPGAVFEPHRAHAPRRHRDLALPSRHHGCRDHPGHRAGQRPAGLLAGAGGGGSRGEAPLARRGQGSGPTGRGRRTTFRWPTWSPATWCSSRPAPRPRATACSSRRGTSLPTKRRSPARRSRRRRPWRSWRPRRPSPSGPTRCSWAHTWSPEPPRPWWSRSAGTPSSAPCRSA